MEVTQSSRTPKCSWKYWASCITLFVLPANLLVRMIVPENWNVVMFAAYDGKREDSLQGTTLHLSFIEYSPPVIIGDYGAQDAEVFIQEYVVSVHGHGKWVADLNVLEALGNPNVVRAPRAPAKPCSHINCLLPAVELTAIDLWEEFLELLSQPSVVRAHGTWVARLGLAAVGFNQLSDTNKD